MPSPVSGRKYSPCANRRRRRCAGRCRPPAGRTRPAFAAQPPAAPTCAPEQPRRPRPRRQHHGAACIRPLVGLHADDLALLHVQRLDLDVLAQIGPVPAGVLRQRRQGLHRVHAAGLRLICGQLVVGQTGVGVDLRKFLAVDRPHFDAGLALGRQVRLQGGPIGLAHHQHQAAAPRKPAGRRSTRAGGNRSADHRAPSRRRRERRRAGRGDPPICRSRRLPGTTFPAGPRAPPAVAPAGRRRSGRSRRLPPPGCRMSETSFAPYLSGRMRRGRKVHLSKLGRAPVSRDCASGALPQALRWRVAANRRPLAFQSPRTYAHYIHWLAQP